MFGRRCIVSVSTFTCILAFVQPMLYSTNIHGDSVIQDLYAFLFWETDRFSFFVQDLRATRSNVRKSQLSRCIRGTIQHTS
jgi:hypothetical protein